MWISNFFAIAKIICLNGNTFLIKKKKSIFCNPWNAFSSTFFPLGLDSNLGSENHRILTGRLWGAKLEEENEQYVTTDKSILYLKNW